MAQLTSAAATRRAGLAPRQFAAIAWLRWRILCNSFRRKAGALDLVFRILRFPVLLALAAIPTAGAGVLAWIFAGKGHLGQLVWLLWAAVILAQVVNLNLGQPGTTFDPTELGRFPLSLSRYVLVRLGFGLLSPSNVTVTAMSAAVAIGVAVARPTLLWPALATLAVFALTNVLFTRMIFAWVDRWLSTRRAREFFAAFILIGSLGLQYINVRLNPAFQANHGANLPVERLRTLQHHVVVFHAHTQWLPPELAAGALASADAGRWTAWLLETAGCACFAMLFLAIYSVRMRTEFRGESLGDQASTVRGTHAARKPESAPAFTTAATDGKSRARLPLTLGPLLSKEWLVLRRNIGLFYGLIAPALLVFLFAGRLSARSGPSHWVLLGAVTYAMLGIAPMTYNSFGTEGTGAQFYFMAPVPLREVFLAKNVFCFLLAMMEVFVVLLILTYIPHAIQAWDVLFVLLWAIGTLLLNTSVGNLRSVSAPKKQMPGRTFNRAQSPLSAWIAIGMLLLCAALAAGCQALGIFLHQAWLPAGLTALFAAIAIVVYDRSLRAIESYAMARRDVLFEELGRKT